MKAFNVNLQLLFPDDWTVDNVNNYFLKWGLNTPWVPRVKHVYTFDMDERRGKGADPDGT